MQLQVITHATQYKCLSRRGSHNAATGYYTCNTVQGLSLSMLHCAVRKDQNLSCCSPGASRQTSATVEPVPVDKPQLL
jgi:hypothetical protein